MSALGFVILVVVMFFVIGIGVGVIAVIALAVTRRDRASRRVQPARRSPPGATVRRGPPGAGDGVIAEPADDETGYGGDGYDDGTRPQWPDSGYRV